VRQHQELLEQLEQPTQVVVVVVVEVDLLVQVQQVDLV
tara:strand:+ start:361 stop:474 length:114 start_codon:yes stop_codon:yes gene_type:complete